MLNWYSGDSNMIEPFRMEEDPDGTSQQVAVIMTGKVYREAGLKYSKHPEVEGMLYDKLCQIGKHKLRDDVRKMALSIALSVSDKGFKPTVAWLDNFMRRFCLSKKKMGFHSSAMLKQKGSAQLEVKPSATIENITQEDVFSVLGFTVDCDPSLNTDSNKTEVPESEDLVNAATSGQDCVKGKSSDGDKLLTNNGEEANSLETVIEEKIDETLNKGVCKVNASGPDNSTTNNVVDNPVNSEVVPEMDDACTEEGSPPDKGVDTVPDALQGQETLSAHKTQKDKSNDEIEEVVLDDDDETIEADNFKGTESKIGKISIKKFEDLCEEGVKKEKKDSDNNGGNSEKERTSDSFDESEDDSKSDSTSSEEMAEASGSDKINVQTSKQVAIKQEKENIQYSKAETKYYNKNIDALQKRLEESVMKCASCYEQVNHHIRSQVFTHPVLGIFICKKCRKYYGKGKFCKDKEGYDEYCRLCAEGGDLLCCEQEDCFNGFCKRCVKRTMGRAELKRAETTEGWACYVCDPMPLMELRAIHRLILSNLRNSEEEDAALSRKDLKTKTLKNKFKSLKQIHQLKAQRETRQTSSNITKVMEKNSKSDNNITEKGGEISKGRGKTGKDEKTQKNLKKVDTNILENGDKKPCPILRNALDEMHEMLSKCLENIKIIETKWKKSKYSSLGTEKARHHVVKQLEAMRNNFEILGNDLLEGSEMEITKENVGREHNEIEQSGKKQKRSHSLESKKQNNNAAAEQSDSKINLKEEKFIQQKYKSLEEEDTSNKDGKISAEKKSNSKSNAYKLHLTEIDLGVAPSDRFTDPVDQYEECSHHSSKACIPFDDEHSLPDLVDVIKGLISDHEEPMDMEGKMTMIKSLDIKNEGPELSEDVRQKKKSEEYDSKAADLKNKVCSKDLPVLKGEEFKETPGSEKAYCEDRETSNSKTRRNRRLRSAMDESGSGSDAEDGNKTVQKSSQQHKRRRLSRVSDEDNAVGRKLNGKGKGIVKNKDVLDSNETEDVETSRADGIDNKNNDAGKSANDVESDKQEKLTEENINGSQKSEDELRPESNSVPTSSRQHKKLIISRDNDGGSNEEDENLNKKEKCLVKNRESLANAETKMEIDKVEGSKDKHKEAKKEGQEGGGSGGNDTSDKEVKKGSKPQRNRKAGKTGEYRAPSEEETEISKNLLKKKKKGNDQNVNNKKSRRDQEKKTSKERKSKRCQQRRWSENIDDDGFLGLVENSETSEEENTDEEIQRRRHDHTEKREKRKMGKKMSPEKRGEKKKMGQKKLADSETEDKNEKNDSPKVEIKDIKAVNSIDRAEGENGNRGNEHKEDLGGQEDKKIKNKTEEDEAFSCEKGDAAVVEKERDLESEEEKKPLLGLTNDTAVNIKGEKDLESPSKKEEKNAMEKKKVHSKTENQKAKASILESDSDAELEDKPKPRSKKKHYTRHLDLESEEDKESLPCITSDTANKRKRERDLESSSKNEEKQSMKKKKVHSTKTENQKAKAAILESESDAELEDKPKPRSKKKHYRRHLDQEIKGKSHKKLKVTLTEKEQEELRGKQLNGKCQVLVDSLSLEVQKKLDEDEFIDTTDYPDLRYTAHQRQELDSDGCDADEEDSDKEFSKLMKFKSGKIKPGPKSKSLKLEVTSDGAGEISDGGGFPDDEVDKGSGEGSDASNGAEKTEDTDKNNLRKVRKIRKEGLLDIDIDKDGEEENEDEVVDEVNKKKIKDGGISLNEKMKHHILMSSDEEVDEEEEDDQGENPTVERDEEEKEKKKYEKKKEEEAKKKSEALEDSEEEDAPKVHKRGYMNLNISTDDEKGEQQEEEAEEEEEEEEPESAYEEDSDFEESPRKRRAFQISSSDSECGKKTKKTVTTDDESEQEDESPKSKRKRIRKMSSSSDEDNDEINKESPGKHKKIRKVIRDEDLMETTKNATQEEEERRKRIAERQKNYNQIFMVDVECDQKEMEKLVLDFDPDTKSELVTVHEKLVKFLKPHQFKGIKFMWDATVESIEQLKTKPGGGCILAHCMGLGKTLQIITFCHTLLTNKTVSKEVQRIMVCCPVNTIFNWVAEFSNWLKGKMLPFDVIELASAKDLWARAYRLDDWWREGGICIIGYNMFRNLSNGKNKRFKGKMKEIFQNTLLDPGPDIIVCDEGHMLKNEKAALSIAVNKVRTKRRIVLTGTPLQNNLKEYHCMIQFVKANLLGTKKEFMNRFVNPIEQGQCVEAMPRDVRRMKRRAHILHNLLEGCVQRFDYTVLKPFLPPKFEYVVSVQLSEVQCKLYQYYLDNLARGGPKRQGSGLFVDFGALSRVWTHPKVLELAVRRAAYDDDEEEELSDFICDDSTTSESSDDERPRRKKNSGKKKDEESDEEEKEEVEGETEKTDSIPGLTESGKVRIDWWKKVLEEVAGENFEEEGYLDKLEHGGKIILMLDILTECCSIGDKVLLFSQSLLTLDMIEDFLHAVDKGELELPRSEDSLPLPYKCWKKERDYLRLDGSTSADTRKHLCNTFNNPSNERCRLFLISTRAGGLGINLVGANRVIVFDSSWNPSHDTQSIFRVYRFGQKKPCYIYRFVAQGTMEEKIYSRQVTKMSTALRVVDEHQIKRYFKMNELAQLYEFNPSDLEVRETPIVPKDRLLAELLQRQKDWIVTYHEHESLLENQTGEELTEEERKAAWEDYENEKKGFMVQNQRNSVMSVMGSPTMMNHPGLPSLSLSSFSLEGVVNTIKSQNPNLSQMEICESVLLATKQIQKIHLNHYQRVQAMVYNLKNPMIAPEQRKLLPFGNHPEMLPMLEQQLRLLEDNIQRENQVITHIDQGTAHRNQLLSTANLMSAGLIRGQPASSGISSATANYVERPSSSSAGLPPVSHSQEKNTASNDVILLD